MALPARISKLLRFRAGKAIVPIYIKSFEIRDGRLYLRLAGLLASNLGLEVGEGDDPAHRGEHLDVGLGGGVEVRHHPVRALSLRRVNCVRAASQTSGGKSTVDVTVKNIFEK